MEQTIEKIVYIGGSQDGKVEDYVESHGPHLMFAYFMLPQGWHVEHYYEEGVDSNGHRRFVLRVVI